MTDIKPQIQETHRTPNRINIKTHKKQTNKQTHKLTCRSLKTKYREKILKVIRIKVILLTEEQE